MNAELAARRTAAAAAAPGIVKIRLAGDTSGSDVLVQVLREHPAVEILTGPDRYSGGRQYLLVRVAPGAAGQGQP